MPKKPSDIKSKLSYKRRLNKTKSSEELLSASLFCIVELLCDIRDVLIKLNETHQQSTKEFDIKNFNYSIEPIKSCRSISGSLNKLKKETNDRI